MTYANEKCVSIYVYILRIYTSCKIVLHVILGYPMVWFPVCSENIRQRVLQHKERFAEITTGGVQFAGGEVFEFADTLW